MKIRSTIAAIILVIGVVGTLSANDRALFDEAERRFTSGDFVLAVDRYRALMERYPTSEFFAPAELRSAQALYYLGRYTEALARLQRAAARSQRGREQVVFWLGLTHYQLGDYPRAESTFSEYLDGANTEAARAHLYRGLSRRELGRVDDATADIEATVTLGGIAEQGYAAAVLFNLYNERGRFADSVALWERVGANLDDNDDFAELRVRGAADAALAEGNVELARDLYRRLSGFSIESAQWAYLRLFELAAGDTQATQAVYRDANRRLAPEPQRLAEFWFQLGADALGRERFEVAELYLYQLWELRTQRELSGLVPLYLARAIAEQARPLEAYTILETSLQMRLDAEAERRLYAARLALELERFDDAVALLEVLPAPAVLDRLGAEWYYTSAYALYAAGGGARALDLLDSTDARARTSASIEALRLRARLALENADSVRAVRAYREFMAATPPSAGERVELLRALLGAGQDRAVLQESQAVDVARLGAAEAVELPFLVGVAALRLNDHERAYSELSRAAGLPGATALQPLLGYHLAWAAYRTARLPQARAALDAVDVGALPTELVFNAKYLASYVAFQLNQAGVAIQGLLELLGEGLSISQTVQVRTLLASVYLSQNALDPALEQYRRILTLGAGEAETAAAWSRYASVLDTAGRSEEAIEEFLALHARYPEADAGRNALIEAAQLAFTRGDFRRARDLFRSYLSRYPGGSEFDRALYWAGSASFELGEGGAALLWWEPLIEEYPRSAFTPRALFQTAQLYRSRGQLGRALELYDRLAAVYRGTSFAADAERQRAQLRLELEGLSNREAQLWVRLEGSGAPSAGSEDWFALVLELGRIAVREQVTLSAQRSRIVDYLISAVTYDRAGAADAAVLLAEYYQRRGEIRASIDAYLQAAGKAGASADVRAQSLYQVAVLSRDSGDTAAATRIVDELRRLYPTSVWTSRAAEVVGGRQ